MAEKYSSVCATSTCSGPSSQTLARIICKPGHIFSIFFFLIGLSKAVLKMWTGLHKINTGIFCDVFTIKLESKSSVHAIPTHRITHAQEHGIELAQRSFSISECFALQFQHFFHGIWKSWLRTVQGMSVCEQKGDREGQDVGRQAGAEEQLG